MDLTWLLHPNVTTPAPAAAAKKYKHCCLGKSAVNDKEFARRRLRTLEGELVPKLGHYALDNFRQEDLESARGSFSEGWSDLPLPESDADFNGMFIPWIGSLWPAPELSKKSDPFPRPTVAIAYLSEYERRLPKDRIEFIVALIKSPYSFYQIREVIPGKGLLLREVILGEEVEVAEMSATQNCRPGNILFTRVLKFFDANIMVGGGRILFPPQLFEDLMAIREIMLKNAKKEKIPNEILLTLCDQSLRAAYFSLRKEIENTPLPVLHNTDGDLLAFCRLTYNLKFPIEMTFARLSDLCFKEKPKDLLENADRDADGKVVKLDFSWLKKGNLRMKVWDSTIMGTLVLEPGKLTVETNSEERARLIRREIDKRLGVNAEFIGMTLQAPGPAMQEHGKGDTKSEAADETAELMKDPEVHAQVNAMMNRHWEKWFDEKIPMLRNKTPRQAAKTKEGLELLESLFYYYEQSSGKDDGNLMKPDIPYLKRELGLK